MRSDFTEPTVRKVHRWSGDTRNRIIYSMNDNMPDYITGWAQLSSSSQRTMSCPQICGGVGGGQFVDEITKQKASEVRTVLGEGV